MKRSTREWLLRAANTPFYGAADSATDVLVTLAKQAATIRDLKAALRLIAGYDSSGLESRRIAEQALKKPLKKGAKL